MNDSTIWVVIAFAAAILLVFRRSVFHRTAQPTEPEQTPLTAQPPYDALYVARLIIQKLEERNAATSTPHRYLASLEIEDLQRLHMHHGYPAVDSPLMDSDDYAALESPQDES